MEMPMRLLVASIILTLTVSIGFGAVDSVIKSNTNDELAYEAERIAKVCELVFNSEPGTQLTLHVDIPSSSFATLNRFIIGDGEGGDYTNFIRYRLEGESWHYVYTDAPVDGPYNLTPGKNLLTIKHVTEGDLDTVMIL